MNFRSNGKLLISGEYLVLLGAKALAVPTQRGQELNISEGNKNISWQTNVEGKKVFEAEFNTSGKAIKTSDEKLSATLESIFRSILNQLDEDFFEEQGPLSFLSNLEFPQDWGLGSSSSLINNLATWAECDPYLMLRETFGGSGYDIACANSNAPITFRLKHDTPVWEKAFFDPEFKDRLFFVHLGKKQSSREAVERFQANSADIDNQKIEEISNITEEMIESESLNQFGALMTKHELIMSEILEQPPVREALFSDYPYPLKSLGAWGGDFILAVGSEEEQEYFRKKDYETVISYSEMVNQGG